MTYAGAVEVNGFYWFGEFSVEWEGPSGYANGLERSSIVWLLEIVKVEGVAKIKDFRSISLVGSVYKLITEMLARKMTKWWIKW